MKTPVNIFWFRRDLRLSDNAGLYHALRAGKPVVPVFIFDRNILGELLLPGGKSPARDGRVAFIDQSLRDMQKLLAGAGSSLDVRYGLPRDVFTQLLNDYAVDTVFTNHDYEPYASARDGEVADLLQAAGAGFRSFKDQVIFEKDEVVKDDGKPYTVFTPYSRKWKTRLSTFFLRSYPSPKNWKGFHQQATRPFPGLREMGFDDTDATFPAPRIDEGLIRNYGKTRDLPGIEGTSRLGIHLRFGTISIRELARAAFQLDETFLNELIWRDFYQAILWHYPHVVGHSFKQEYDRIKWRNDEKEFEAWCQGRTGYPIVDAGMRQLNETGYMHNRVRMIVASFLTRHLLIDWRRGEAYFAKKLLDFDLAANNGGWQWAAGSGCDAAPYFRIFNPYLQTKKFDPELKYVRRWVPEYEGLSYPPPIVEHEFARKRCLEVYSRALKK